MLNLVVDPKTLYEEFQSYVPTPATVSVGFLVSNFTSTTNPNVYNSVFTATLTEFQAARVCVCFASFSSALCTLCTLCTLKPPASTQLFVPCCVLLCWPIPSQTSTQSNPIQLNPKASDSAGDVPTGGNPGPARTGICPGSYSRCQAVVAMTAREHVYLEAAVTATSGSFLSATLLNAEFFRSTPLTTHSLTPLTSPLLFPPTV